MPVKMRQIPVQITHNQPAPSSHRINHRRADRFKRKPVPALAPVASP